MHRNKMLDRLIVNESLPEVIDQILGIRRTFTITENPIAINEKCVMSIKSIDENDYTVDITHWDVCVEQDAQSICVVSCSEAITLRDYHFGDKSINCYFEMPQKIILNEHAVKILNFDRRKATSKDYKAMVKTLEMFANGDKNPPVVKTNIIKRIYDYFANNWI